jgi:NADH:ubiquinone oxidoreductase subunit E
MEETASFTGVTVNDVWSVASFYTNFRFTPPGRHIIDVCWGPTCHLLGAQKILRAIQTEIGIEEEGETEDGDLTLRYSTCLGACAVGPVIGIDHHLIGRCDEQSAVSAVADAKTDV